MSIGTWQEMQIVCVCVCVFFNKKIPIQMSNALKTQT